MHSSYWHLREEPFQNVADANFAYLSHQHREGLARLLYLVDGRKLGGVVVGAYGVGKSMLLYLLGQKIKQRPAIKFVQLDAPPGNALQLAKGLCRALGHNENISEITELVDVVKELCDERQSKKPSRLVISIDEAHLLRDNTAFELMQLLTNIRTSGEKAESAVTLILSGHKELLDRLNEEPALCQRFQLIWELPPLDRQQTIEYVQFRVRAAGGDMWLFENDALDELFNSSGGIPRVINNICDVALLLGCASHSQKVTLPVMQQAVNEVRSPLLHNSEKGSNDE